MAGVTNAQLLLHRHREEINTGCVRCAAPTAAPAASGAAVQSSTPSKEQEQVQQDQRCQQVGRQQPPRSRMIAFPAGNDDFRAARARCARACRDFNETPEDTPADVRVERWLDIVSPNRRMLYGADMAIVDGDIDGRHHHAANGSTSSSSSDSSGSSGSGSPPAARAGTTSEHMYGNPALRPQAPFVKPPIFMDYGLRVHIGTTSFVNRGCIILDTPVADVVIGERCHIGPRVTIVSVGHPLRAEDRREERTGRPASYGRGVAIGDDVWIGTGVIVMSGVTIGSRSVIGAGSVVTDDIPPDSVAVGVPARVVRSLAEEKETQYEATAWTLEDALRCG